MTREESETKSGPDSDSYRCICSFDQLWYSKWYAIIVRRKIRWVLSLKDYQWAWYLRCSPYIFSNFLWKWKKCITNFWRHFHIWKRCLISQIIWRHSRRSVLLKLKQFLIKSLFEMYISMTFLCNTLLYQVAEKIWKSAYTKTSENIKRDCNEGYRNCWHTFKVSANRNSYNSRWSSGVASPK